MNIITQSMTDAEARRVSLASDAPVALEGLGRAYCTSETSQWTITSATHGEITSAPNISVAFDTLRRTEREAVAA